MYFLIWILCKLIYFQIKNKIGHSVMSKTKRISHPFTRLVCMSGFRLILLQGVWFFFSKLMFCLNFLTDGSCFFFEHKSYSYSFPLYLLSMVCTLEKEPHTWILAHIACHMNTFIFHWLSYFHWQYSLANSDCRSGVVKVQVRRKTSKNAWNIIMF